MLKVVNSGEFRHKIEVQSMSMEKINQRPVEKWNTVFSTKAKSVKGKSSEESLLGGSTDKLVKKLLIRTPKTFAITNDFRIIFKNNQYSIKDWNDINDLGKYTEIYIERLE